MSTRLGERTCVVEVAAALDAGAAERLAERVDTAMADGCRDFVLDLTAVRGCHDQRPIAALARIAHRFAGEGCEVVVAARHIDLLTVLASHPGKAWTRRQLLDRAWGSGHDGDPRTVDVHVRWLRSKIEAEPERPVHLLTVRGVGYRLDPPGR